MTTTADITRCEDAKPLLLELAQDIGKRLTLQNKYATKVCVNARSSILRNREWQTELPTATRSPMIIADTAYRLFCDNYDWVNPVRSLTVTAFSLVDGGAVIQNSFFNDTIRLEKWKGRRLYQGYTQKIRGGNDQECRAADRACRTEIKGGGFASGQYAE